MKPNKPDAIVKGLMDLPEAEQAILYQKIEDTLSVRAIIDGCLGEISTQQFEGMQVIAIFLDPHDHRRDTKEAIISIIDDVVPTGITVVSINDARWSESFGMFASQGSLTVEHGAH